MDKSPLNLPFTRREVCSLLLKQVISQHFVILYIDTLFILKKPLCIFNSSILVVKGQLNTFTPLAKGD